MSKKQDSFYFENFISCAECACEAAGLLKEILTDYQPSEISRRLDEIHAVEHRADDHKHELMNKVAKAFITPIEREDIVSLSQNIDEITDKLEDVLLRIYINNVQTIRPDALTMTDTVKKCCEETKKLLEELEHFRRSDKLEKLVIHINTLEEEADALYISSMRRLHTEETDVLQIIAWREIYNYLEKCADACEHVADTVEGVVMKNS